MVSHPVELLSLGPCRLPPGGPQGHQPQAVRPGAAVGAGIILCDPDVSDMLNLLRCTISTTSQSDENYVTIAYNYVLEAMCRWSKGCAGASDENGWSSHREER